MDGKYDAALISRGAAYFAAREYEKSAADFGKAAALQPHPAKSFYNQGRALFADGKTAAALAAYSRAIKLEPDYAKAYAARAEASGCANARLDIKRALALSPSLPEAAALVKKCGL